MPMLVPEIDLVAKNRAGQDVKVTISSQEASFVNGVFAQRKAVTAQPAAAAATTNVIEAPFILPGTSLAFFPIGLVITSIWMGLFFLVVGFGTYGRMQFRDQYRRRMKREMATATNTI
jgi:Flp pilus assembly protein TadB